MAKRPGVIIYFEICPVLDTLSPTDIGIVLRAALEYAQNGTEPTLEGAPATAWAVIRTMIDKDGEAYDDKVLKRTYATYCRECKRAGEDPVTFEEWQNNQMVSNDIKRYPTTTTTPITTTTPTTTPNNINIKETSHKHTHSSGGFTPPSVGEVREYCLERGSLVDPDEFFDFYSSNGWMVGKNKMKDWKASVRSWERTRQEKAAKLKGRGATVPQPGTVGAANKRAEDEFMRLSNKFRAEEERLCPLRRAAGLPGTSAEAKAAGMTEIQWRRLLEEKGLDNQIFCKKEGKET